MTLAIIINLIFRVPQQKRRIQISLLTNSQQSRKKMDIQSLFSLGAEYDNSQKGDLTIIFEESDQLSKFSSFNKDSYRNMQHKGISMQNFNGNSQRHRKKNNQKIMYNDFIKVQEQIESKKKVRKINGNYIRTQNQFIPIEEQQNEPSIQSKSSRAFNNKQTIIQRLNVDLNQQNNWIQKHTSILPQFSQIRSENQDLQTFQQCLSIKQFADLDRNQALKNYKRSTQLKGYNSNIQPKLGSSTISDQKNIMPYHSSQQNIQAFQTKTPTSIKDRPLNLLYF